MPRPPPIKLEVVTGKDEPHKTSADMRRDVLDNNHLFIFATTPDTFGPPGQDFSRHPLLKGSGEKDVNGTPLLFNDLLRGVHDYFAHSMSDAHFGPTGEEAAWKNHMPMTPNMMGRLALTAETRGRTPGSTSALTRTRTPSRPIARSHARRRRCCRSSSRQPGTQTSTAR